ncbi:MAG TPA: helix-turn-helix domain-containing protein [Solirubrobacterales bacterium]|nr:helix-turn-helix domain-containing protein [Solirubrobacterales bacterium]
MTSLLVELVRHDGSLAVLACLAGGKALPLPRLSAETGLSMNAVRHHLKLLTAFGLIERDAGRG